MASKSKYSELFSFCKTASDQRSMGNDEDGDDDWYHKEMNDIAAKKNLLVL